VLGFDHQPHQAPQIGWDAYQDFDEAAFFPHATAIITSPERKMLTLSRTVLSFLK